MHFRNSIGEIFIEENTVIYKNSLGVTQVTPYNPTQVQNLFEYYVVQFKDLEILATDPKRFKDKNYYL